MLLYRGEFLPAALRQSRVAEDEILAAVRSAGLASLNDAEAVVRETDGSFSVVNRGSGNGRSSLDGVKTTCPSSPPAEGVTVFDVLLPRSNESPAQQRLVDELRLPHFQRV